MPRALQLVYGGESALLYVCQWAMSRLNPQEHSKDRLSIIDPPVSRLRHVCMFHVSSFELKQCSGVEFPADNGHAASYKNGDRDPLTFKSNVYANNI